MLDNLTDANLERALYQMDLVMVALKTLVDDKAVTGPAKERCEFALVHQISAIMTPSGREGREAVPGPTTAQNGKGAVAIDQAKAGIIGTGAGEHGTVR